MRRLSKFYDARSERWYAVEFIPVGPKKYKRKSHPLGVSGKANVAKAQRALRDLELALSVAKKAKQPKAGFSVGAVVTQYLEDRAIRVRPSTLRQYTHWLNRFVGEYGEIPSHQLAKHHLREFQRSMLRDGLSPVTVNIATRILNAFCRYASKLGVIESITVEQLQHPTKDPNVLSWDQFEHDVVPHIPNARLLLAYSLMIYAGLRRGEVVGLRWSDVDTETRVLHIRSDAERQTKSGKSRDVPIHPVLVERLQSAERHGPFVTAASRAMPDGDALQLSWRRVVRRAGIPYMTIHALRASFATEMLQRLPRPAVVQQLLGHNDLSTTMRYYARVSTDAAVEAARSAF